MRAFSFDEKPTSDLVSIVVPTYRGERFIAETLESIGCQTYVNWELIVVEDGSHDGTEKIVQDFARKYPSNRVDFSRSTENRGVGPTRNSGFSKARGEFIANLDCDDRWLSNHLSALVDALKLSGKDIAYSSTVMIEAETELLLGVWGPKSKELSDFPQSLLGRCFITPSATLFLRQVLTDVGLWSSSRYAEDYDFFLRCVAAGKRFEFVGGCHCLYRKNHAGAITQNLSTVIENSAHVAQRYMHIRGMRKKRSRRYVSGMYALAASFHAESDSSEDPSVDRSRAPSLLRTAWRLRRMRIDYLWKAKRIAKKHNG